MKKVRTILSGLFGTIVSFENQAISFNNEGVAELPAELADKLVLEHSQVYYFDGQPAPSATTVAIAPAIDTNFAEKFKEGALAKATVTEPTDDQLQAEIEALQAKLAKRKNAAEEELTKTPVVELSEEEKSKIEAIRAELEGIDTNDGLKELLKSAGIAKKKYNNIDDREQLIALIIENDIIDTDPNSAE